MIMNDDTDRRVRRASIKIREMEIDDVPKAFHLGERLFEDERMPSLYRTWDEYEVIELFHSDSELCLVAESNDEIIGFALGTTITKKHSAWKYGYLVWLGVEPSCQRFGIGEKIFNRLMTLMLDQGERMVIVDTETDNKPAMDFFRKMGFGNPQQHIYLTMNLGAKQQFFKKKKTKTSLNNS